MQLIRLDQHIAARHQLSHGCGQGHFFQFSFCQQTLVEGLDEAVPARCHVHRVATYSTVRSVERRPVVFHLPTSCPSSGSSATRVMEPKETQLNSHD